MSHHHHGHSHNHSGDCESGHGHGSEQGGSHKHKHKKEKSALFSRSNRKYIIFFTWFMPTNCLILEYFVRENSIKREKQ
jgi:hypothetical protein